MSSNNNNQNGGIGFLGFLTLIFIGLKLAEVGVVANWSWWWVLSPIWIPITIMLIILTIAVSLKQQSSSRRLNEYRKKIREGRREAEELNKKQ